MAELIPAVDRDFVERAIASQRSSAAAALKYAHQQTAAAPAKKGEAYLMAISHLLGSHEAMGELLKSLAVSARREMAKPVADVGGARTKYENA
jgi:hypothetical protein